MRSERVRWAIDHYTEEASHLAIMADRYRPIAPGLAFIAQRKSEHAKEIADLYRKALADGSHGE